MRPHDDVPLPWVLLANAARARLFERDPGNGALRELHTFVHPLSRAHGSELTSDRPGRAAKGQASTGFAPRNGPARHEHEQFARELARHLEHAARINQLDGGWVLIASSPFLGCLGTALGHSAHARMRGHVERDLTALNGRELEQRVSALLAELPPPPPPA